jgi:hypothetical protein
MQTAHHAGESKPSNGLEPLTPSLPWASRGWSGWSRGDIPAISCRFSFARPPFQGQMLIRVPPWCPQEGHRRRRRPLIEHQKNGGLVGPPGRDDLLLALSAQLEARAGWAQPAPVPAERLSARAANDW